MPVKNISSDEEKRVFTIALNKEQRRELKQILKDHETINKERRAPVHINKNLQLTVDFDDIPFQYQDALMVKDTDKFLDSEYDGHYFTGMEKTSKSVNLTSIEQMLLELWKEVKIGEVLEDTMFLYKKIPSIDAEIKRRMKRQFENQVKLENFLVSSINSETEGVKFLNTVKNLYRMELNAMFEWLLKGETIDVW
jgi:hypothetical protein